MGPDMGPAVRRTKGQRLIPKQPCRLQWWWCGALPLKANWRLRSKTPSLFKHKCSDFNKGKMSPRHHR